MLAAGIYVIAGVTFGFLQSQLTAEEGEVVEVCVGLLTGIIERDVLMSVSSEDGSATGKMRVIQLVAERADSLGMAGAWVWSSI